MKEETNQSHVQEFGDMSISKEPVADFQGESMSARNIYYPSIPVCNVMADSATMAIGSVVLFMCCPVCVDGERQVT